MTVIVGFVGSDGAVMVSDSQASEADRTKHELPKIWTDGGLLFGYSGNTAVRDPIQLSISAKLNGFDATQSRWTVRAKLCEAIRPVLLGEYANYVPEPRHGQVATKLAGCVLVLGRGTDGYWLLDIDHNNVGTFHPERGFHAIGSGSAAAQVGRGLLEHYDPGTRTVWHLKLIAHRTVDTCIRVLDAGVGGAVQVWASDSDGTFAPATEEELRDIAHGVSQWTLIERESLGEVLGEARAEANEAASVELPESLDHDEQDPPADASNIPSA